MLTIRVELTETQAEALISGGERHAEEQKRIPDNGHYVSVVTRAVNQVATALRARRMSRKPRWVNG